jgi:hypothetical protein
MNDVGQVKKELEAAGVGVGAVYPIEEIQDGLVEIEGCYHVQVGCCYLCLVRENGDDTYTFFPERESVSEIVKDLKEDKQKCQG